MFSCALTHPAIGEAAPALFACAPTCSPPPKIRETTPALRFACAPTCNQRCRTCLAVHLCTHPTPLQSEKLCCPYRSPAAQHMTCNCSSNVAPPRSIAFSWHLIGWQLSVPCGQRPGTKGASVKAPGQRARGPLAREIGWEEDQLRRNARGKWAEA